MTKHFAKLLVEKEIKDGVIVNMASIAGKVRTTTQAVPGASGT